MLKKILAFSALTLSVAAFAVDISGVWTLQIQMDVSKLPADQQTKAKAQLSKFKSTVTFKKDKTFSAVSSGTPDGKSHTSTGTWSQTGDTVTLTTKTSDGKAVKGGSQVVKLSKDGKTMSTSVSGQSAGSKSPGPSVTIVFKKKS